MITIEAKETFNASPDVIWGYLTDLENQSWRKNINYIETLPDGSRFTEHTVNDGDVNYNVQNSEPYKLYEVDFENENMRGTWKGILSETQSGGCSLRITVAAEAKRSVYKPYMKAFAKKQMKDHMIFLKEALNEKDDTDDGRFSNFNNISLAIVLGLIIGGIARNPLAGICAGAVTLIVLYLIKKR